MKAPYADTEYGRLRDVLLCAPYPASGKGAFSPYADPRRACRQHERLQRALEDAGVRCHVVPTSPLAPYQAFTRDSYICTPWGLVMTRMGFDARAAEPDLIAAFAALRGFAVSGRCATGTLEGGDVQLLRPGLAVVGTNGDRTTSAAAQQLSAWFATRGWTCRVMRYPAHYRHLDVALCVVDAYTILHCGGVLKPSDMEWLESLGFCLHSMPVDEAPRMVCNTISLGDGRIVAHAGSGLGNRTLRRLGFDVLEIDLDEFVAQGGGAHCLVNALLRDPSGPLDAPQ
jgi:arginine deiminase